MQRIFALAACAASLIAAPVSAADFYAGKTLNYVINFTAGGSALTTAASLGISTAFTGGSVPRLLITTVNGTDTFDAGSINILYE